MNAKILHEIFPVLNCYDEFNIDYCQVVTDVGSLYYYNLCNYLLPHS